ncbi:MAG: PaaI family thioesterase [candidate division Zixibacteria bacterium]|nr:PaaI family thioesterase [candidate division Zixibacteria bacterium]
MTTKKQEVVVYPKCFVCGDENPRGLKLRFFWDGAVCQTSFLVEPDNVGYENTLHGGIIASIIDEVMIKAILAKGQIALTAELNLKYRAPASIGENLVFIGKIDKENRRVISASGFAENSSGRTIATATGKYVLIRDSARRKSLGESLQ